MNSSLSSPVDFRRLSWRLALITGVLPIIAVNLAYVVAATTGSVPVCLPYLEGCTSISSTGRVFPSVWIFKPLMIASGITMAWFFVVADRQTSRPDARLALLTSCGLAGTLALLMYIVFLGSEGPTYRLLRRYGVSLYFGFVFLGQLLLARRFARGPADPRGARLMLAICGCLLALGLISIPISNFVADKDIIENIIEWNFALILQLNFLVAGRTLVRKNDDPPVSP